MSEEKKSSGRVLGLFDCACIIVGTIIGAGIFKMPAVVASNVPNVSWLVAVWVIGGLIALIGALCFAELTTTYPDAGGDYGYLKRAYHSKLGFAFSWTAFWVIRPANIGVMAMIFGEFARRIFVSDDGGGAEETRVLYTVILAVFAVALSTGANLMGLKFGKTTQNVLTVSKVGGILLIVAGTFLFWQPEIQTAPNVGAQSVEAATETDGDLGNEQAPLEPETNQAEADSEGEATPNSGWFWLAMVFVMFTFGGWNDIAFMATEVDQPKKNLLWSLVLGTLAVSVIYLLIVFALVYGLGFERLAELGSQWQNATSILVEQNLGVVGGQLFSLLVCVSCLGAINAMILTSPRIYWATATDFPAIKFLAGESNGGGWWRAMVLQGVVTLIYLFAFGLRSSGFENLAAANAPFFWSFLALTVFAMILMRLRKTEFVGYRAPLFPLLPILFIAACIFMIQRSVLYMLQEDLEIQSLIIGVWVLIGFGLSLFLGSRPER